MLRRHQQLRPPKADLRIRRGVDSKGDTPQDDKDGNHLSHQRNAYTVQALNEDLFRYSKYRAYRAIQWKAQRAVYEFYRLLLDVRKIRLESGVPRSVAKPLPEVRPRLGLGFPEKLLSIMMSARAFKASPYIPRRRISQWDTSSSGRKTHAKTSFRGLAIQGFPSSKRRVFPSNG